MLAGTVRGEIISIDLPLASQNLVHVRDIYPLIIQLNVIQKMKSEFSTGKCSALLKKSSMMCLNFSHSVFVESVQCCGGSQGENVYPKYWINNIIWNPQLQEQTKQHRRKPYPC